MPKNIYRGNVSPLFYLLKIWQSTHFFIPLFVVSEYLILAQNDTDTHIYNFKKRTFMTIFNIQDKKEKADAGGVYDLSKMKLTDCESSSPVYNEVLRIFRNVFEYIDISKILKNL